MRSLLSVFALGVLASGLTLRPAVGATASISFGVSATVQASCRASVNTMGFKTYLADSANTTSPVSVSCSNSAPYNVDLSAGTGFGDSVSIRQITGSGTSLLGYALRSSAQGILNRAQTVGTDTVTGTGNRSAQVHADHDQISAERYIAGRAYSDTITVTVTY